MDAIAPDVSGSAGDVRTAADPAGRPSPGPPDAPGPDLRAAWADHQAGRRVDAERVYRRVIAAEPDGPRKAHALHLLGLMARDCGHTEAAGDLLRQSVEMLPPADPAAGEFRSNWAAVVWDLGRQAESADILREAVRLAPGHAAAHHNLGFALQRLNRLDEAEAALRRAVDLDPEFGDAYFHLGEVLRKAGRLVDAEAVLRQALARGGPAAAVQRALAGVLADAGRLDEAVACRRRVVELNPRWAAAGSELLFTLYYHPAYGPAEHLAEARAWAARHADPLTAAAKPHANDPDPDRRLRVGYVSPDFRDHPIARLVEPLLALHDRGRFEVYCYSDVSRPDAVSRHIRPLADAWRDTPGVPDAAVADRVRADGIDVLVDLAGHFGDHRLTVFARRPAPVQVSALGYCGTTGLRAVDWRVTDEASDPTDPTDPTGAADASHAERLWRLPAVAWAYRPFEPTPDVAPPPAAANGFVTFGCVNNLVKVTDAVVAVWARVLAAVPRSRLALLGTAADRWTAARFAAHGVDPGRIEIVGRRPRWQYLQLHNRFDVCLDPFPFNGDNTLCDALWMGVPTVTLVGVGFAARRGLSHLSAVGLAECVARDEAEYVATAARLASDPSRLADLRAGLRSRLQQSPLGDAAGFVRDLEAAYREMWREWCVRRGGR